MLRYNIFFCRFFLAGFDLHESQKFQQNAPLFGHFRTPTQGYLTVLQAKAPKHIRGITLYHWIIFLSRRYSQPGSLILVFFLLYILYSLMSPLQLDQLDIPESQDSFLDGLMQIDYYPFQNYQFADDMMPQSKQKKSKKSHGHGIVDQSSHWLCFDDQVLRILGEDEISNEFMGQYEQEEISESSIFNSESQNQEQNCQQSENIHQNVAKSKIQQYDRYENLPIQWFKDRPEKDLIAALKLILETKGAQEDIDEDIKSHIKESIDPLLFDYERYYIDQLINQMEGPLCPKFDDLNRGISRILKKKIGGISFTARRIKLVNYLAKKKSRNWKKKVNYDCRKKVADKRLRIQGKFVTMKQACQKLGESEQGVGIETIKKLLSEKKQAEKITQ